jgi:hypothetical protein
MMLFEMYQFSPINEKFLYHRFFHYQNRPNILHQLRFKSQRVFFLNFGV